jgi:hypothetical protein
MAIVADESGDPAKQLGAIELDRSSAVRNHVKLASAGLLDHVYT